MHTYKQQTLKQTNIRAAVVISSSYVQGFQCQLLPVIIALKKQSTILAAVVNLYLPSYNLNSLL